MNSPLTLQVKHAMAELGPEWDPLFAAAANLQSSRAWFDACIQAALPDDARPHLLALSDPAGPLALIPMVAFSSRLGGSLTTPYTCLFQPLLRPGAASGALTLREFGQYCRRWPATRFEALDPDCPSTGLLRRSFASAGLSSRTFAHFGNWYETMTTRCWDAYVQSRPGALRETIRRRTRAAARAGTSIQIARDGPALAAALDAYEAVYSRSWKEPEPYLRFNDTLVRSLARTNVLRISVMWSGDVPIAAQYWSIVNGSATILKLAHDQQFKSVSPGTVLTAATIRELIEVDGVTELDFGRGDDAYKRGWASRRRPRVGIISLNPRTLNGLGKLITHDAGTLVRRAKTVYGHHRSKFDSSPLAKPKIKDSKLEPHG